MTGDDPQRAGENRRIACARLGADIGRLAHNHQVHSNRVVRAAPGTARRAGGRALDRRAGRPAPRDVRRLPADRPRPHTRNAVRSRFSTPAGRACWPASSRRASRRSAAARSQRRSGRRSARAATRWGRRSPRRTASASATTSCTAAISTSGRAPSGRSARPRVARVDRFDRCTSCEPETFFSHRRDNGVTGRQGVIAYVAG